MKPSNYVEFCLLLVLGGSGWAESLRLGFGTNKPPYVFEAEQRGLEVDIVSAAARRAGFQPLLTFAPLERQHRLLQFGQLDAIATTNEQSGVMAYYSKVYLEYHNIAVALALRKLNVHRIEELGKYSVSTFQRARVLLGQQFQRMADANPRYREEGDQIVRNRLLFSGHIDVIVGDSRIIRYFNRSVSNQVDTSQPVEIFDLFPPTPYRVGFRSASLRDRFDAGLLALKDSGEYAAIEQAYAEYGEMR
jgi:polar amino acid transport system substrate-binding protein